MLARWWIQVNQYVIDKNNKTGQREHPITVKHRGENYKCSKLNIFDKEDKLIGTLRYSPDSPLVVGNPVWLEIYQEHAKVKTVC